MNKTAARFEPSHEALPHGDSTSVLARVQERAATYFPELGPAPRACLVAVSRPAYSVIYRISLSAGDSSPREVVVKVMHDAERQFRAMMALWRHFSAHPHWKIPRPLDYLGDAQAIVMEAIPGTPLPARFPRLVWNAQRLRRAELDCRGAGQWLRYYHELGCSLQPTPLDIQGKRKALAESLRRLAGEGFDPPLCDRVVHCLDEVAGRIIGRPFAMSQLHGDFKVDNLFVCDNRVTVLDLSGGLRGAVEHDIASFLNSLLLLRLTRPIPAPVLLRLRQSFLEGYFGGAPHDESSIVLLQGIGLADTILEIITRRRSRFARVWVALRIRRGFRDLAEMAARLAREFR